MPKVDTQISTPRQKVSALIATRDLLWRMANPQLSRRVGDLRAEARALLRHYPTATELRPLLMDAYGLEEDELTPPRHREIKREPNGNRWMT